MSGGRRWWQTRSLVRRLREVPAADLGLLAWTFFLLLVAKIALATTPVQRVLAFRRRSRRAWVGPPAADQIRRTRWAVLVVARYAPVKFVCFPQCLAASALLRRAGIASRLHYGVKRGPDKLETHTWLEAEGQIVIGGEVAGEYSLLETF